jgi:hypothetical protein
MPTAEPGGQLLAYRLLRRKRRAADEAEAEAGVVR